MARRKAGARTFLYYAALIAGMAFLCSPLQASDGRIPVYESTTLSSPGSYYLTRNLSGAASGTVISIQVPAVTLDLNGFTIAVGGGGIGVSIEAVGDIRVTNGMILDGATGVAATSWGVVHLDHLVFTNQTAKGVSVAQSAPGYAQPVIEQCKFNSCLSAIYLSACKAGRIERNEIYGSGDHAIWVASCLGVSVLSNTIAGSTEGYCIRLVGGGFHLASGNLMSDFSRTTEGGGISCASNQCTITDNVAAGGPACDGFSFISTGNRIRGNTALNVRAGFSISADSGANVLQGNMARGSVSDGFYVNGGANLLEGNTASGNAGIGFNIVTVSGSPNVLRDNTAVGNTQNWSVTCTSGENLCVQYGAGSPTNIPGP
jgi:parallel beta-helix repeat protein